MAVRLSADGIRRSVEESLQRPGVDRLDVAEGFEDSVLSVTLRGDPRTDRMSPGAAHDLGRPRRGPARPVHPYADPGPQRWTSHPSTNSSLPVPKPGWSEARKSTAFAISSVVPMLPSGTPAAVWSRSGEAWSGCGARTHSSGVSVGPGRRCWTWRRGARPGDRLPSNPPGTSPPPPPLTPGGHAAPTAVGVTSCWLRTERGPAPRRNHDRPDRPSLGCRPPGRGADAAARPPRRAERRGWFSMPGMTPAHDRLHAVSVPRPAER